MQSITGVRFERSPLERLRLIGQPEDAARAILFRRAFSARGIRPQLAQFARYLSPVHGLLLHFVSGDRPGELDAGEIGEQVRARSGETDWDWLSGALPLDFLYSR
jgi:hypothetical protein